MRRRVAGHVAGQTPQLAHDFLEGRNGWMAFVQTALMPNCSARDPFVSAGLGSSLEQMQSEVPLSARGGLVSLSGDDDNRPSPSSRGNRGRPADTATEAQLLDRLLHAKLAHFTPSERGTVRPLHALLENMKELAMHAGGRDEGGNMVSMVRGFVVDLWQQSNRLSAREAQLVLSEMFHKAAAQPAQVARLMQLWLDMLQHADSHRANVFLEPERLTLVPFATVFIGSNALQLALTHYLCATEDADTPRRRGGIDAGVLDKLLRVVLAADKRTAERIKAHIASMVALAHPGGTASLAVSSAHVGVEPLAAVLSAFVSGFKHHAADPAGRAVATAAVERLEKVSLVRQQLQRQILSIVSSYDRRSSSSSSSSSSSTAEAAGPLPDGYSREELLVLTKLHELLPMTELHRMKEAIVLDGLVPCPSLENIYRQLNGVKGRLLGDGAESFQMPSGAAGAPAAAASAASRKEPQGRGKAKAQQGNDPHAPVRYRLKVSVMGLRGLKEGAGKVYVHVRCHGHGHKSAPAFRSGRTAAFAESVQYQFDDLDEQQLLGLQVFEDVGGGHGQLLMGGVEVPMARMQGGNVLVHSKRNLDWYELRRAGRGCGEVGVELQLLPMPAHAAPSAGATGDSAAAEEDAGALEQIALSGQWCGYTWHSGGAAGPVAEAVQAMDLELVFSEGGELPTPHHQISGAGSDLLGTYELSGGKLFTEAHTVEWLKTYPTMHPAFAPREAGAAAAAVAPQILFRGSMDPTTRMISGDWHMCVRMSARAYRQSHKSGGRPRGASHASDGELSWCDQLVRPGEIGDIFLQARGQHRTHHHPIGSHRLGHRAERAAVLHPPPPLPPTHPPTPSSRTAADTGAGAVGAARGVARRGASGAAVARHAPGIRRGGGGAPAGRGGVAAGPCGAGVGR